MNNQDTGFFKSFKVTKYAKQFLIATAALAVLAAAVIAIFGFNLAYQYKGGYKVTVQTEDNRSAGTVLAAYKESLVGTIEGLKDTDGEEYGLEIISVSVDRVDIAGIKRSNIVLTAKLIKDEDMRLRPLAAAFVTDLKDALDATEYKVDNVPVTVSVVGVQYSAPVSFADAFTDPLAYILLAAALICVYFAFRYNLKEAAVTAYILFSDAVIFLALLSLTRIPVIGSVMALLGLTMIESLFGLSVLFGRIRSNRGTPGYTGMSEAELAEASYRESFKKLLIIAGVSAVAALALLIGTADSMVFGASAFIAVLCGAANAIFVAPALCGLFKEDKKPVRAKAAAAPGSSRIAAKDSKPYYAVHVAQPGPEEQATPEEETEEETEPADESETETGAGIEE